MRLKRIVLQLFTVCTAGAVAGGGYVSEHAGSAFETMTVERLPDMNVPRNGHSMHVINGEPTVFGGHSTGYIPTATAEYYSKGRWHLVDMVYPHDLGAALQLPTGQVFLFGGCEFPVDVGQSYFVERYDPISHQFSPLPIMDRKRARPSAVLLSDGTFVVSGNWKNEDGIAFWSPASGGERYKEASAPRMNPHILPVDSSDAIIFGSRSNFNEPIPGVVDRLHGEAFTEPLLEEWHPVTAEADYQTSDWLIGDESEGRYDYLTTVEREDGQAAIVRIKDGRFSMIETARPLPKTGVGGDAIRWLPLFVDRSTGQTYVPGVTTATHNFYLARIAYGEALDGGKSPVSLYHAELDADATLFPENFALLSGGRICCAGGSLSNNYQPSSQAYIFHTSPPGKKAFPWWIIVCAILLLCGGGAFALARLPRKDGKPSGPAADNPMDKLMARISAQMEEEHLFLKAGLTKEDVAWAVGSNSRYVSDCINTVAGCSFIDYVNGYRIRYAQQLLIENPDMRSSELSEESGFSSEITFYRNFKSRTGMTPGEWLSAQNNH